MELNNIISKVDHTALSVTATKDEITALLDDAVKYKPASVCIPPCYVEYAVGYLKGRIPVCTVIGFPNGYNTTEAKCFEAKEAVLNGAEEIDMVINIGELKMKNYSAILNEINRVKDACGEKILKVIVEACLLTEEEKIKMCEIVSASNADFIKTSTGFSSGGAVFEDIALFKKYIKNGKKIKAAGEISSLADAESFISLGADRLGTSRIINSVKENEK